MPRFSAKAKELHDAIWYNTDIVKAKMLLEELTIPLDIAFGKLFIQYYYMTFEHQLDFLGIIAEIDNENKKLKDQFLQFIINLYYYVYYMGWNTPPVNKELALKYLDEIEESYQGINYKDEWEKYYTLWWYFFTKATYEWKITEDFSNAIKFQKQCIDVVSKDPEEGDYYSAMGHVMLGLFYMWNGNFEEAERSENIGLTAFKEHNNAYQVWPLGNLFRLYSLTGNFQKAKELNIQHYNVSKEFEGTSGIFISLTMRGDLLFDEGSYEEAFEAYQESLTYRKQYNDPLQIFIGYFNIFTFHYQRYKITTDRSFFLQADQTLVDLKEISKAHPDNNTIVNFTNYTQALIFKHGNIIKKGKAIGTFHELIELYPTYIAISLEFLELLFEDYLISEDKDTINQIDELMEKIGKVTLRNNPEAIRSFVSQQIFLAKYIYYIKGDISVAINILHNTTDHVKKFKLSNLEQMLDTETQILEKELTKWENADITIKERIKKSQFDKYIQQALKFANQQK